MIHVSELAYSRVKHPEEILSVGQTVRVQVLRVADKTDKDGRRQIALSLRALAQDPWEVLAERFPVGSTVSGKVTRVESYGAFVELLPGVEGLVHVSKLSLDRRLSHARQAATVGQDVEVTVVAIDASERRVSLSMVEQTRQARENEAAEERQDQERFMGSQGNSPSLGTFADLLDQARKK
jgi:small subunit ribosomal protein S1